MDCLSISVNERDQFIQRIMKQDNDVLKFYDYDPTEGESFERRLQVPNNGREKAIAK